MMVWAIFSIFLMYSCSGTSTYLTEENKKEKDHLSIEFKTLNDKRLANATPINHQNNNSYRTQRGVKKYAGN